MELVNTLMYVIDHFLMVVITGTLVAGTLYGICRIAEIGRHHIRKHK